MSEDTPEARPNIDQILEWRRKARFWDLAIKAWRESGQAVPFQTLFYSLLRRFQEGFVGDE